MGIISRIMSLFNQPAKAEKPILELSMERTAQHEAAHGVVWYLFRDKWTVNKLTIQRENLPDENMRGALHISPNFDVNRENSIERANELFAIALAGMIGQNINMVLQRQTLLIELGQVAHFNQIFDTQGCGGDFEIAKKYLPHLGESFQVSEGSFTKYKIMDLVDMFQGHRRVQQIHAKLAQMLLGKGTIDRNELLSFFEGENFQEYIEDEDLDRNFFHRR